VAAGVGPVRPAAVGVQTGVALAPAHAAPTKRDCLNEMRAACDRPLIEESTRTPGCAAAER
jgi:hypothetical protein